MIRRNTPSKEAVMQVLQNSKGAALSQDMIEEQLSGKIDRATIYRILNRFCEDGITHKIVADDGKKYFALCHECENNEHTHHNHIHFKCLQCGQLECLEEHIHVKLPSGYKLQDTQFLITGLCQKCNKM
jgi:Fur family ferric uptake transcriptional regulator